MDEKQSCTQCIHTCETHKKVCQNCPTCSSDNEKCSPDCKCAENCKCNTCSCPKKPSN